ncbi:MAG: serine hydrolase [Phenylobacterium sp.]
MRKLFTSIIALSLLAAAPAFAAGGACPAPDFRRQAREALQAFDQGQAFSGAVLVAVDGKPVLREALGLANREWNVANTADTKFRLGSITKQFTATAILQLAEQGKLSTDDPLSKYYPEAPASWSKVTIKHLLTHTSGIPTYTGLASFANHDSRLSQTPADLIKLVRDKPLDFEPGSRYAYDNTGYVLLGYIVEKLSGQKYADYLQAHIFGPLGMRNTGYDSSEKIIPRRAAGYGFGPEGWENAGFTDMSTPFAAGALYSTVDDMLLWDQALYGDKVLSAASKAAMFTNYGHSYGFGVVIDRQWDHDRIWHNGGINGFVTSFQRYPKDRVTVVALSNFQAAAPDKLAADLAGLCLGAQPYPKAVALPATALDRFAGAYQLNPASVMQVERDGDRLRIRMSRQPPILLYATGEHGFFARTGALLDFQVGEQGQVTGGILHQRGQVARFTRIDAGQAKRQQDLIAKRFADQTALPGSEAAMRRLIGEFEAGKPDYARMSDGLAQATRVQISGIQARFAQLGALQALNFRGVGPGGADIYEASFAGGKLEFRMALGNDGVVEALIMRPLS